MKFLVFSAHAEHALSERDLERAWIEATVASPDWRTTDPNDVRRERLYRAIPEREERVLRVVVEEEHDSIRIVTAFFDRRARRP